MSKVTAAVNNRSLSPNLSSNIYISKRCPVTNSPAWLLVGTSKKKVRRPGGSEEGTWEVEEEDVGGARLAIYPIR